MHFSRDELFRRRHGIELDLLARTGSIEKRFTVVPGADPSSVTIDVEGAERLELLQDYSISIAAVAGSVLLTAPAAWQETSSGRTEVAIGYVILGSHTNGFAVGSYGPAYQLIASTFVSGTGNEVADNLV